MVRSFDLKAEAEMRLESDRRAEELARERREEPTSGAVGAQAPVPADGPSPAGVSEGGDRAQCG